MALSAKHQRFVDEYLVDLNGAQAAIRAGYSPRRAKETACRLVTDGNIAAAIAAAQAARAERTEVTQDWVIARLRAEATFEGDGASHGARIAALDKLAKHLGLYAPVRVETTGKDGGPIEVSGDVAIADARLAGLVADAAARHAQAGDRGDSPAPGA